MGKFLDSIKNKIGSLLPSEIRDLFSDKKNVINLLILGILILGLFLFITIRQQQIIKTRASSSTITFVGSNVEARDGKWVAKGPQIQLELFSAFGPPGELATPAPTASPVRTTAPTPTPTSTTNPTPTPTSSPVPKHDRRYLCVSTTVSPTTLSSGGKITITSTAKEANLQKFRYAFYNRDNSMKIICHADKAADAAWCPNGGGPFIEDKTGTGTSLAASFDFAEFDKTDTNWGNQKPNHLQVNGYFIDQYGMQSWPETACTQSFDLTTTVTTPPTCVLTGPSTATIGQQVTFNATATGHGKNIQMVEIYVQKPGTSGLVASDFVQVANRTCNAQTCTVLGNHTFNSAYNAPVTCNAYYQTQFTGNKADECSGNLAGVQKAGSGWSDCGSSSRITVAVPPSCGADRSACTEGSDCCSGVCVSGACYRAP